MIEVQALQHVSITVTNLNRAREFYGGVLRLTEIERPAFDFEGAWYEVGSQQLHLIVHPASRARRGTTDIDSRDSHYALRIRSHQQAVEYLQEHGVPCRERLRNRTPWPQIFLTDPDGNVIELNAEAP
jgi:catechol 2,3-dioxygenase-like lactoylglutathione lyase family enzyme